MFQLRLATVHTKRIRCPFSEKPFCNRPTFVTRHRSPWSPLWVRSPPTCIARTAKHTYNTARAGGTRGNAGGNAGGSAQPAHFRHFSPPSCHKTPHPATGRRTHAHLSPQPGLVQTAWTMHSTTVLHVRGAPCVRTASAHARPPAAPVAPTPTAGTSCSACRRHCTCGHPPDLGPESGEESVASGPAGAGAGAAQVVTREASPISALTLLALSPPPPHPPTSTVSPRPSCLLLALHVWPRTFRRARQTLGVQAQGQSLTLRRVHACTCALKFERLQAYLPVGPTGQALEGVEDYLRGAQAKLALVSLSWVWKGRRARGSGPAAHVVMSDILPCGCPRVQPHGLTASGAAPCTKVNRAVRFGHECGSVSHPT